jgi:propionyl-CoA carboxylase alpha chain
MPNHERRVGGDWVARIGARSWQGKVTADGERVRVELADGGRRMVGIDQRDFWRPLVRATVDGRDLVVKVERVAGGYRLRHRGADLRVTVLSPRHAALAATLPEKAPPDTSRLLLCPMPGLVVRIDVAEGEEVFDGQALCMVEAMKMENVLRAERRARVARIRARPGDSLAVDDVIMEFE